MQFDVPDDLYEKLTENGGVPMQERLMSMAARTLAIQSLLAEKGIVTVEEVENQMATIIAAVDQMESRVRERYENENPGAAMVRKLFGSYDPFR